MSSVSIFQTPTINHAKNFTNVKNQGFEVDDDNDPVTENIPVNDTSTNDELNAG